MDDMLNRTKEILTDKIHVITWYSIFYYRITIELMSKGMKKK